MTPRETVTLSRDCEAIEIPFGTKTVLPKGAQIMIEQSLGGSYTVLTDRGTMVRIDGKDADAMGLSPGEPPQETARPAAAGKKELEDQVWEELKTCFDPEIPVNIVDLGLVYGVQVEEIPEGGFTVHVTMTLTAPGCGMGDILKEDAENKIAALSGVKKHTVEMVVDPPWDPSRMSDAARLQLNMF
jgi:probable FeS assembly SUF system protein SufT